MDLPNLNASLIKNQAESHVSLASINVDFSLIRVQPPSEYHDVGKSLSLQRNEEAETGQSHATASKLGVLFDGIVPPTPNLIRAYGLRCSEIAKSPTFNPKGTEKHGLFASQVGADGTTIWAAATSGSSSIGVHLLACMLARIWESPKAISIWVELIAIRKQALESSQNPMDSYASRITLSREQIANWDASARAWCLTADQANEYRQKQLRLIIDHLGIPVSPKLDLSESVIDAWRSAMITVDKLIAGEPQSVQTGAPLLGLASWHLYPDMIVFGKGKSVKDVKQKDSLIHPGGILTLGIEDTRRVEEGIYWSLPLAHLRYYGDPVVCETSLHSRTSRVSIDQLVFVALGSLIRRWCADANDIESAAELLVKINDYYKFPFDPYGQKAWMPLLAYASQAFLQATGNKRLEILQLIKCGRRRYAAFVDDPRSTSIFGLSDCQKFLSLLPGNRDRVSLLREVAKSFSDSTRLMVIQCRVGSLQSEWEISSVEKLPGQNSATKALPEFIRWVNVSHPMDLAEDFQEDAKPVQCPRAIPYLYALHGSNWENVPNEFYSYFLDGVFPDSEWQGASGATVRSHFLCGDPDNAALYSISVSWWKRSPNEDLRTSEYKHVRKLPNIFVIRHIAWAFDKQLPSHYRFCYHLFHGKFSNDEENWESDQAIVTSLKGLLTVKLLYDSLPNATVELKVASRPLCGHQWIPHRRIADYDPFGPFSLTQEQTFACIAKLESGNFNFSASAMNDVLAISSGNSLYVARCLLRDPCEQSVSTMVGRVVGNLGKSGMVMLVSPGTPRVRPATHDYALVNHDPFDGSEEDCFQHTTLHMTFTEWQLPIDVGSRGTRDVEAYYLEAAIGVYDHGKWVADVNILDVFRHRLSRFVPPCTTRHEQPLATEDLCRFVAIDSWEELLDSPVEVGVFRARNNWQARLAAAALSIQRGHETRILADSVCWTCCNALPPVTHPHGKEEYESLASEDRENVIDTADGPVGEEDSDSEMDEVVMQEVVRSKKRKIDDLDYDVENQRSNGSHMFNRNIVYIM